MGFNYNKHKNGHNGDSMWTSYSDLFLGLSIVFLLLYVTASLRQGTDGIQRMQKYQQLTKENQDIRQQLKVYNTIQQNQLAKSSNDEQENYKELMDKLSLLQDEANTEKNKLRNAALENEKKEMALNKYQQMIRNIINSNVIAKSRIKERDEMINTNEVVIEDQDNEIKQLETNVAEKKSQLAQGQQKIAGLEDQLDGKMKQLKQAYKSNQITKKKFEEQQKALQADTAARIASLKNQNQQVEVELKQVADQLKSTTGQLQQTQTQLTQTSQQKAKLETELKETSAQNQAKLAQLKNEFENQKLQQRQAYAAQMAKEKQAFDAQMAKERLSQQERLAKEAKFKAEVDRKEKEMQTKMANLDQKYQVSQKELSKALENLNAKKDLAGQIKKNFTKNGIGADVDPGTGDVVLSFGDHYFESDRASLRSGMQKILEQAIPVYAASLFDDPKVVQKIQSVEIVGFASPTYRGKYIDPRSLSQDDRAGVNYNLDLSYNRARAIFNHIFDQNKMQFKHQKTLLPLVKVTGRSFFDQANDRKIAAEGAEDFCRKNDCAKLQRVIIKFNLKD